MACFIKNKTALSTISFYGKNLFNLKNTYQPTGKANQLCKQHKKDAVTIAHAKQDLHHLKH